MTAFWLTLGKNEQQRTRNWSRILREHRRFPCGDCGQWVTADEHHDWHDCRQYERRLP